MRLLFILPLLLLTGCFLVEDFGEYWAKGTVDPKLEGTWTDVSSRTSTTLVKRGDAYGYATLADPTRIKTLKTGGATFLMMQGATNRGIIRYTATDNRMIILVPNPVRKADFINRHLAGSRNFMVTDKGIIIRKLDDNTITLLGELAKDESYWKEQMILEKGQQLSDKELKKQEEKELENFDAPDPFSNAREEYKDVIGQMKTDEKGNPVPPLPEDMDAHPEHNPFTDLYKRGKEPKQ